MENKFVITEICRVVMVGKHEYPEKKTSFSPNMKHNELIFHFSGHATVFFDDLTLETKPNTIRFLPQSDAARYDVVRHENGDCIVICFRADRTISPHAFVTDVSWNEKIGPLFKKLFAIWVGKSDGYYFESVSLLYRIFAELQKKSRVSASRADQIEPALEWIHNFFLKETFSVQELAAKCNMSESYFQKLFQKKYSVSPKKYIIQLKINHACDLLRFNGYTVTQIAEMCNFSDVYFFSRQFKEYMGITPTQFIQKYKSGK